MLRYPVTLTPDSNGSLLVSFVDIPEANSVGDDEDEALLNALDALACAMEIYFGERRVIPVPSTVAQGQTVVTLPALESATVLSGNEMLLTGESSFAIENVTDSRAQLARLCKFRGRMPPDFKFVRMDGNTP